MAEAITLARPYAEALFKMTKESLAPSKEDIDLLDVIFHDKNLLEFLANPTISKEEAENFVLSLIHISEPTRRYAISYAVFCLKKKKK